mmetsp:Transcript_21310/g.68977  ORF Transcript_21310/g.68977 Transcript_21310/m.68977 type:complete len:478 (+) Transcript_21310:117-1550(+)
MGLSASTWLVRDSVDLYSCRPTMTSGSLEKRRRCMSCVSCSTGLPFFFAPFFFVPFFFLAAAPSRMEAAPPLFFAASACAYASSSSAAAASSSVESSPPSSARPCTRPPSSASCGGRRGTNGFVRESSSRSPSLPSSSSSSSSSPSSSLAKGSSTFSASNLIMEPRRTARFRTTPPVGVGVAASSRKISPRATAPGSTGRTYTSRRIWTSLSTRPATRSPESLRYAAHAAGTSIASARSSRLWLSNILTVPSRAAVMKCMRVLEAQTEVTSAVWSPAFGTSRSTPPSSTDAMRTDPCAWPVMRTPRRRSRHVTGSGYASVPTCANPSRMLHSLMEVLASVRRSEREGTTRTRSMWTLRCAGSLPTSAPPLSPSHTSTSPSRVPPTKRSGGSFEAPALCTPDARGRVGELLRDPPLSAVAAAAAAAAWTPHPGLRCTSGGRNSMQHSRSRFMCSHTSTHVDGLVAVAYTWIVASASKT